MGIMTKISKIGYGLISSKTSKKAMSGAVTKLGGSSKVIKTTAQTIGSDIPAIAGGKPVQKAIADVTSKGLSGSAVIGRKIAKTGLYLGGTAGALTLGGAKIYDYVGDVRSKTPELREYDMTLGLMQKELDMLDQAREKKKAEDDKTPDVPSSDGKDMSSSDMAQGGSLSDFFPVFNIISEDGDKIAEKKTSGLLIVGLSLAALGTGIYLYRRKKKR